MAFYAGSIAKRTAPFHRMRRGKIGVPRKRWNSGGTPPSSNEPASDKTMATVTTWAKSFAIGATAGTCGSLAGMGGGFLMIPMMTSKGLMGLTQHQAHATSLFAVATTGMAGALSYSGQVDYEVAAAIAACGMATAGMGAHASARMSQVSLKKALGVFMLLVAPTIPAKEYLISTKEEPQKAVETSFVRRYIVPAGIGCCSGFLAGVFGVGGGAIVVPALSLFTDMNHYQALGTSLCAMVPTAVVGTATHMSKGTVAMRVAPALAVGAFAGAYYGGKLGLTIPEQQLKYGFSGTMVVLGLRTLLKA
mmetsp:Transcript_28996/g.78470  ORF Transcript_28996/g.78470 Transcript_28996/m.78470 type:complete len:306 (+) Transcript_28996:227-1144(+)